MMKLRHFTRRLDDDAPRASGRRDCTAKPLLNGRRSLLPSASGRITHVFLVATRRMPGFDQGMFERLLRLASLFPRISLAVHQDDAADFRARITALDLSPRIKIVVVPAGATLWPWAQDRVLIVRNGDGSTDVLDTGAGDDTGRAAAGAMGVAGSFPVGFPLPGGNI